MKPVGAIDRVLPLRTASGSTTAATPPKWSTWLCVKITATIGRSPSARLTSASAAAAVSVDVSGSTRMRPFGVSMTLMFEMS